MTGSRFLRRRCKSGSTKPSDVFRLSHHRRVLEIGCGSGLLLLRLGHGAERYVGTDFSPAALYYRCAENMRAWEKRCRTWNCSKKRQPISLVSKGNSMQ